MTRNRLFPLLLIFLLAACSPSPVTPVTPANPTATETQVPLPTFTNTPTVIPTSTPVPQPALPVAAAPALSHIDFQNEFEGWGIAVNDSGAIVRTVDAGRTWLNATPAGAGQIGLSTTLFVLDSNHAWALIPGTDFYSASLYRTTDGGLTWTSNQVPFGSADIQFLDASTGRALADRGAGAGSNAVGLYQTSDGGVTWTSVFHNDPTEPGSSDSLPLGGIKNGMFFLDAATGWVSGSLPVPGNVYLYVTHDGGVSWTQESLQLPAGDENDLTMAHPPLFFGQAGLLPLTIYLPNSSILAFYSTHDGGLTWSAGSGASTATVPPGRYSFADAVHGWSWDGSNIIFTTTDGGQSWESHTTSLDLFGKLTQIDFVPSPGGTFTGWALSGLDETNHSTLYQTHDNGAAWTVLNP